MKRLDLFAGKLARRSAALTIIILSFITVNAFAGQPTDQLKETLDQMVTTLNNPAFKSGSKIREKRDTLHSILKCRFDEQALAERALGSKWKQLPDKKKQAFIKVFIALLEKTYFDKIDAQLAECGDISGDNIRYVKEKINGDYAQIETRIMAGESEPIPVIYRLKNDNGNWRVVDMAIEGVIITKNYRAQFDEILARNSFDDLIKQLETKLASE